MAYSISVSDGNTTKTVTLGSDAAQRVAAVFDVLYPMLNGENRLEQTFRAIKDILRDIVIQEENNNIINAAASQTQINIINLST